MVFRPFYVQKEFLRKIPSLPDFDFRDSDNAQTVILENIIISSGTFFISGGYLRTVVGRQQRGSWEGPMSSLYGGMPGHKATSAPR